MPNELPHAVLTCSECGTSLRITLKKGRPPSKPVPCPKCKAPISVTQDDVVSPGKKSVRKQAPSELRATRAGPDILRETRLVELDPDAILEAAESSDGIDADPPTAEVDPPTAEVPVDDEVDAAKSKSDGGTPKFGIIRRRGEHTKPRPEPSANLVPGIEVVKGDGGAASRDKVFASSSRPRERIGSGVAIGRIVPRRVPASIAIDADDPQLPAPKDSEAELEAEETLAEGAAPEQEPRPPHEDPQVEAANKADGESDDHLPKLDLSKLKGIKAKLQRLKKERELSEASQAEDARAAENAADEANQAEAESPAPDLDMGDLESLDLVSEADFDVVEDFDLVEAGELPSIEDPAAAALGVDGAVSEPADAEPSEPGAEDSDPEERDTEHADDTDTHEEDSDAETDDDLEESESLEEDSEPSDDLILTEEAVEEELSFSDERSKSGLGNRRGPVLIGLLIVLVFIALFGAMFFAI